MTGYHRCLTAIQGGVPDRVPAYTPTIASDVAGRILGRAVHTGGPALWYAEAAAWCDGPSAWQEFDAQVTEDVIALHRALDQAIVRFPYRNNIRPTARIDATTFLCGDPKGKHQVWRWDEQTMNFLYLRGPTGWAVEDWPKMARETEKNLDRRIAQARENAGLPEARLQEKLGDSMMVVAGGAGLSLGVDEAHLMAALLEPGAVADLLDCQLAVGLAQLEGIAARGVKAVLGGGDMADKNGPLYSPGMFARYMLPRWKRIAKRSRELGLHYVWRSDGNLWKVSDMLFREARMPGFGEVDFDATMTSAAVRARYPEVVIWANLSGDLLRRGSAEEAYRHSMQVLESSRGRGYFHGCSNTILPGTPVENVTAMMQARDDYSTSSDATARKRETHVEGDGVPLPPKRAAPFDGWRGTVRSVATKGPGRCAGGLRCPPRACAMALLVVAAFGTPPTTRLGATEVAAMISPSSRVREV
jgi:uroporphyrinogen-III decarboxylase